MFLIEEEHAKQENVWGITMYPDRSGDEFVEFDSMINLKPAFGNRTRGIENADVKEKVVTVVKNLVKP